MGIVMDMSSYEVEHDNAPEVEYGEEILCSGWNPALELACQQVSSTECPPAMPSSLVTVDAETFLEKMYAYQR